MLEFKVEVLASLKFDFIKIIEQSDFKIHEISLYYLPKHKTFIDFKGESSDSLGYNLFLVKIFKELEGRLLYMNEYQIK